MLVLKISDGATNVSMSLQRKFLDSHDVGRTDVVDMFPLSLCTMYRTIRFQAQYSSFIFQEGVQESK